MTEDEDLNEGQEFGTGGRRGIEQRRGKGKKSKKIEDRWKT